MEGKEHDEGGDEPPNITMDEDESTESKYYRIIYHIVFLYVCQMHAIFPRHYLSCNSQHLLPEVTARERVTTNPGQVETNHQSHTLLNGCWECWGNLKVQVETTYKNKLFSFTLFWMQWIACRNVGYQSTPQLLSSRIAEGQKFNP